MSLYEIQVRDLTNPNTVLGIMGNVISWSFTDMLSDLGSGEVVIDANDPVFDVAHNPNAVTFYRQVFDEQHIWQIWQDGVAIFAFMSEDTDENHITDDGKRACKISGRQAMLQMEWGTVLPPGFPTYTLKALNHTFTAVPAMAAWLTLLGEAQGRGACPLVAPTFGAVNDSGGNPWADSVTLTINPGGNLLDLLIHLCESASAEWHATAALTVVAAAPTVGLDRSATVVFFVQRHQKELTVQRTRRNVRNSVYTQSADGHVPHPTPDASSITKWGLREGFFPTGTASEITTAQHFANVMQAQSILELISNTFKVIPDQALMKQFVHYGVGDTVTIESDDPRIVGANRIMAISMEQDEQGVVSVELTTQTILQRRLARLQKQYERDTGQDAFVQSSLQVGATSPNGAGTAGVAPSSPTTVVFSYPGALDNLVESPPWYSPVGAITFTQIRVSLLANATSNHVIALFINGVQFAQYTLTAGSKTMTATISAAVGATDPVTIKTITVSDFNLSVELKTS